MEKIIIKKITYFLAFSSILISSNAIAKDYSGFNLSIAVNATNLDTWIRDNIGHNQDEDPRDDKTNYDNSLVGLSWSAGYDRKWDSVLPFGRDLYTGLEIGGTYLTDDMSSNSQGRTDYVIETHFRGHQVISGGLELGTNLGQGKISFDSGVALADILNISWDYDDGRIDFANSPHTRDTVPGFYLGLGLEHLFTSNFGFEMGIRYYNFGTMDLNWADSPGGEEESAADQYYKYENTLTQAQFGLVYYFGK